MTDVPSTDDVRDIWVDYHLNPLPRAEGIALVPEYQQAFDAWLGTIRADERARMAHLARVVPGGGIRDVRSEVLADLRAKVAALQSHYTPFSSHDAFDDVLALIDGGE